MPEWPDRALGTCREVMQGSSIQKAVALEPLHLPTQEGYQTHISSSPINSMSLQKLHSVGV